MFFTFSPSSLANLEAALIWSLIVSDAALYCLFNFSLVTSYVDCDFPDASAVVSYVLTVVLSAPPYALSFKVCAVLYALDAASLPVLLTYSALSVVFADSPSAVAFPDSATPEIPAT
jgi:hypothetical protein